MVQRRRGPDFSPEQGLKVGDLAPDEVVIREEWLRRRRAREMAEAFDEAARQAIEVRYHEWGVRPDDEVSTDAVVAASTSADGWDVRWTFAAQDGQLVARSVHIAPSGRTTPLGGITGDVLRALSPAKSAAVTASEYRWRVESGVDLLSHLIRRTTRDAAEVDPTETNSRQRPGRPKLSDGRLREVAIAYLEELEHGRGVIKRVAERLGIPADTARDWVRAARREHFLTPAIQQGRRGASPGSRLLADNTGEDQ